MFLDHGFKLLPLLRRQDRVNLALELFPDLTQMFVEVRPQLFDPFLVFLEDVFDFLLLFGRKIQVLRPPLKRREMRLAAPAGFRPPTQDPALGQNPADDSRRKDKDERNDDPKFRFFHGTYLLSGTFSSPVKIIIMFLFSSFSSSKNVFVSAIGLVFRRRSASGWLISSSPEGFQKAMAPIKNPIKIRETGIALRHHFSQIASGSCLSLSLSLDCSRSQKWGRGSASGWRLRLCVIVRYSCRSFLQREHSFIWSSTAFSRDGSKIPSNDRRSHFRTSRHLTPHLLRRLNKAPFFFGVFCGPGADGNPQFRGRFLKHRRSHRKKIPGYP